MDTSQLEHKAFEILKNKMDSYFLISPGTWSNLRKCCSFKLLKKNQLLYPSGQLLHSFSFVVNGLFRVFITNEDGQEYNKNFFDEGTFPGSMTALLTSTPSQFAIEALEASSIIMIDFKAYRDLMYQAEDLKMFQIHYLERNWLLAKDAREVEIVQKNATQRYEQFLENYPGMNARLPQYHIASHLGITPTQLSRIRKKS